ncbi:DUF4149 domain-containing protein [Rhodocyclus tenuis]|uniref:DUF4149 domain-containing protein n=1 Tax=Rhodocyclus tenuis TaxID=1066 RepID=A0A6L5JWK3_RHOTE|nr:DUF4149 domain-containing protein [Rhodocyclus gracilis]MRD71942.1 DUF4149 domain-containing protein [Rhodocyclus gracilis]
MRRIADALSGLALTLWVGGLWSIGYLVAPTLFATLADRQLAGAIAGKLFQLIGWIGFGCAAYLILHALMRQGAQALRRWSFWLLVLMVVLALIGQFGVQPVIAQLKAESASRAALEGAADMVLKDRFATWHGIASVLYLVQSLLGAALVVVSGRQGR